ncbi:MAG TPA: NDP-sugar synthase [Pyrinomonadaceae bacterium]|nr:NDP-sugar synthase [Pyrinomonadaceae bacterium]
MRAIILSAGYGTRLWPLTEDRTKPAIPILGKPLVGYVAEYIARYGCDEVVVNLHHQPESVRRALGDGSKFGVKIHYIEEPEILGTSGALDNARSLLEGETFIAINGKIITDINLRAAIETHRRSGALATLVLVPNHACERFSVVEAEDGLLRGFSGMPAKENFTPENPPLMFTGIHVLDQRIFEYIPKGVFSDFVVDVYLQAMAKGERIAVHVANESWYELSTIHRYLDISLLLMAQQRIGTVVTGNGSTISGAAEVAESILWDNVAVEDGATVRHSVLADNVVIPAGETVENAAVVCAELVRGKPAPPKALKGEFKGNNFVVPLSG